MKGARFEGGRREFRRHHDHHQNEHELHEMHEHHEAFGAPGPGPEFGPGYGPGFGPGFPGGGPGGHGHRRGRGGHFRGRVPRGDVRAAVLRLLAEGPMHGYQLMQAVAERSEGVWRPSPGAIYPVLSQLEDEGLVELTREHGRKQAVLTDAGQAYLAEHDDELGDPFAALKESLGDRIDLRRPVEELATAARQLARSGTAGQQERARKVLREARRSLYLILADDDDEASDDGAHADESR